METDRKDNLMFINIIYLNFAQILTTILKLFNSLIYSLLRFFFQRNYLTRLFYEQIQVVAKWDDKSSLLKVPCQTTIVRVLRFVWNDNYINVIVILTFT